MVTKVNKLERNLQTLREGEELNKLFVYGIFLGEKTRQTYGMSNPQYAVVKDFVTSPLNNGTGNIVEAIHVPNVKVSLTGLTVDVDPTEWNSIDALEAAYERIKVKTSNGIAYMYARKGTGDKHEDE